MAKKKVLIAGVSGLVGGAALTHFAGRGDCEVVGVSRRKPAVPLGRASHISVDLADRAACADANSRRMASGERTSSMSPVTRSRTESYRWPLMPASM